MLVALDVDLALPGHGSLIDAFGTRIEQLCAHHDARLQQATRAANGADAYVICQRLFPTTELSSHQLRFAMAETLAHLEYLVAMEVLEPSTDRPVRYMHTYGVL